MSTKQIEHFDELVFEVVHDLRRGDHKAAARVVDDIPDDQVRGFCVYLAEALHGRKLIN